jgi:hypothetical protein
LELYISIFNDELTVQDIIDNTGGVIVKQRTLLRSKAGNYVMFEE